MEQLPLAQQLDRYRSSFVGPQLDLVLASMIAGNTAGQLWEIPEQGASPLLLLWDQGNNVFYLAGDAHTQAALSAFTSLMDQRLRPQALAAGSSRFKVRALTPWLEEALPHVLPGIPLHASPALFSVHEAGSRPPIAPPAVPNMALVPITADILRSDSYAYIDQVRDEIRGMWPSEERFDQHGFGSLAILDDEIICWCTAEYASPTHCGIGIATSPRYEGRGLATATAAHFVQQARERGITPCWECALANQASVRVAEKVGFVRQAEEAYWIGEFPR